MKFPRIKDIFASRTKFPKLVTSLLADILSKEMRYSGMKTPKSETMTIHTIQIKLYCLMVLEKKRCKKNKQKEGFALPLLFPLHQTLKIQKIWNITK
jgi:hypothetical protein